MPHTLATRLIRLGLFALAQAAAAALFAAPCAPSATTLCLNGGRFQVDVQWKDSKGRTGAGQAVPITADTGDFWFFSPANVELVVKVLDARSVNGNYWVFYGALSNVEYTMVVTDTATNRVKTYANPQGQFASVGDTKAFTGSSGVTAPSSSWMDVEGFTPDAETLDALQESTLLAPNEADAAPAPCDGLPTDLRLNGCRFRISVSWKDSKGRTGAGQPVPLTNDTGYFWFFSPANVELVIKVLDARSVNGNFWVFYGALSNVEYTLTVADTLTGVVHTYSNSAGQFASVGDTKAFHPGYSVAAHLDTSRAVSQLIPEEGGTLSTTAKDGTVFTLTIPEGALLSQEQITMTPVASADRFPLSGGLAAAVQLAPEGLLLFQPATLMIAPPAPISSDQEVTFAWRGSGEEFSLYPPDPTGASAVSLSLAHLSTYGVGRGSSADLAAQRGHSLANKSDQLAQDLQGLASEQRKALRSAGAHSLGRATGISQPAAEPDYKDVLTKFYLEQMIPIRPTDCQGDFESYLVLIGSFLKQVLLYTAPDSGLLSDARFEYSKIYSMLEGCYADAYSRCKTNTDPSQAPRMARIYEILKTQNEQDRVDKGKIPLCLTFELTFTSFVEELKFPPATFAFRHSVKAVVPGISYEPDVKPPPLNVPLNYLIHDYTGTLSDKKCSLKTSGTDSVFTFVQMFLDLNVFEGGGVPPHWLTILIDPGHPQFTSTITCPGAPAITQTSPRWRIIIDALIALSGDGPVEDVISSDNWKRGSSSQIFALNDDLADSSSGLVENEISHFELKHTPQ